MNLQRNVGLVFSVLVLAALLSGATHNKESLIATWKLDKMSHGSVHWRSSHPVIYTVHELDAEGGHVRARYFAEGRRHCFADVRYRWKFNRSIASIQQGQSFGVTAWVSQGASNPCGDLSHARNPNIRATGGNGVSATGSVLFKHASLWARYLIWGDTGEIYQQATQRKPTIFIVRDSTKGGIDMNSDDGYLKLSLNSRYEVVYKFASIRK